ncbi:type II toxin-antitoxin system PemK/MazF family toxin [Brevundimonas variabilis]|uniref:mRNA interferase MazF n=1 Tax=Brevundimonas variabilis TaxID=74312 RepID=A0A7W9CJ38_9CAUL|nr:type II toxin-antitoxin system PemK/MazF family toxin [Brevundimonas variabilis]MBB5746476.1 mRNA interferase MazF [Brevundimonas variabilis]
MRRCDVVIVALPGDKPRPALVLQSDELLQSASVLVCPFTSGLEFASPHRVVLEPATANGLRSASVLMTEKMQAIRREKCGDVIGHLTASEMAVVEPQLAFVLGLGSTGTS